MSGFTLIESLLVVALFGVVAVFMFPLTLSFYNVQILSEIEIGVQTALQNAQVNAVTQKNDSAHGVKMLSDSYVLFQGDSYLTRNTLLDTPILYPSTLEYTGVDEIVFEQYTGKPSATGTLSFEYAHESKIVTVYDSGFIR